MPYYFIVNASIHDQEMFGRYQEAVRPTMAGHDMKVLVSTFDAETMEGEAHGPRAVVIEFPSKEAALAWYESSAYQAIIDLRLNASDGFAILAQGR
jgi:uncharacterized protein (DUF1330 family)